VFISKLVECHINLEATTLKLRQAQGAFSFLTMSLEDYWIGMVATWKPSYFIGKKDSINLKNWSRKKEKTIDVEEVKIGWSVLEATA